MRIYKILSFSAVILLIIVLFAGVVTVPVAAQSDTMQFRYNVAHTGDYSAVAGSTPPNNQLKWNYKTGFAASIFSVSSSPVVVNGVVYVGCEDHNIYALNATTGAKLWNYTTSSGVESSPAVINGVVYVGSNDHNLYALSATTGAKLWNFTSEGRVRSSPALAGGVVYISSDIYVSSREVDVSSWNGTIRESRNTTESVVYAINANTGAKVWNHSIGRGDEAFVLSSPAVANGIAYVGSNDHNLYALSATTGAKLWNYTTGNGILSSPAVANGIVYVGGADNNIYALNASTGTKVWSYTFGSWASSSPAVANGIVYFGSGNFDFFALNATTGAKLWNYTTGGGHSSSAVANGVVYVGSWDGNVYALDAGTGVKVWNFKTEGAMTSSPTVANGVVYVQSTSDDGVYAICAVGDSTAAAAQSGSPIPSFEVAFAVIGLVIGAYIASKRR